MDPNEKEAAKMNTAVFDKTAEAFAARLDRQIEAGRFSRGKLFLQSVKSSTPSHGSILDYGCGPGRISAVLARNGFKVLGLDPSLAMIQIAKQQPLEGLDVEFKQCTGDRIEVLKESSDAIVCSSVIEYESDPDQLLRWLVAALRPSGVLVISFANRLSLSHAIFQFRNLHLAASKHMWSENEFNALLERNGFRPRGDAIYFHSVFDRLPLLGVLSSYRFIGALGLMIAQKA